MQIRWKSDVSFPFSWERWPSCDGTAQECERRWRLDQVSGFTLFFIVIYTLEVEQGTRVSSNAGWRQARRWVLALYDSDLSSLLRSWRVVCTGSGEQGQRMHIGRRAIVSRAWRLRLLRLQSSVLIGNHPIANQELSPCPGCPGDGAQRAGCRSRACERRRAAAGVVACTSRRACRPANPMLWRLVPSLRLQPRRRS